MPVNTPHAEYVKTLPKWERARDCREGSDAVKAKGPRYLPKLDSHMTGVKGEEKYQAYLLRALYYNATGRTVEGLQGLVMQKAPEVDIPEQFDTHPKDITLTGVPLEMFTLETTGEVITTGRWGILVEMSTNEKADQRPYWIGYRAESIVSWRTERRGGDEILTRVVLRECEATPDPKDPYATKEVEQYRVLELARSAAGADVYQVSKWRKKSDITDDWVQEGETVQPIRRGAPLDFIPFVFIGPTSVSPRVERPPVDDLAEVNLSHYRTMGDLEHGRHWTALPTPWVAGLADNNSGELSIGSGSAWVLGENGRAGMLEFTGQGLGALEKADEQKRHMMATLGARLLEEQPKGSETATAVGMRHSGQHATLRTIAQAVEQGLTRALQIHVWWMAGTPASTPDDVKAGVALNKEFFSVKASPEEVKAAMLLWQGEAITFETLYERLQTGGWTREGVTAEEEKAGVEREKPLREPPKPEEDDPDDPPVPPKPEPQPDGDGGEA